MEPARAPVHGLGVVGPLPRRTRPGELRQRDREPAGAAARAAEPDRPQADYAWTDLTYLLHKHHVSWRYYVFKGAQPDCDDGGMVCKRVKQNAGTPGIWNPLPWFDTVKADHELRNIVPMRQLFAAAKRGALPAVSWVTPSNRVSEHPPRARHRGQTFVTSVVNAIMRSPDWKSTAIFLAWDDWGGFYDHVVPPNVDENGYGLRVPGARDLAVRAARLRRPPGAELRRLREVHRGRLPRARRGSTRPPTGARTRGRRCARTSRCSATSSRDFDFNQKPRPPLLLPLHPPFS